MFSRRSRYVSTSAFFSSIVMLAVKGKYGMSLALTNSTPFYLCFFATSKTVHVLL